MSINESTVTLNGLNFHYAESGSGRLMLFLHGFPEFWYLWKDQLEEFGKDHRAVAPDQRGYNLSDKPESVADYNPKNIIADIGAMLAHFNDTAEKPFLVAHDWGGAVAWSYAALYPETIAGLVIVNAPHPTVFLRELIRNPDQQQASQYMRFFQTPKAEERLSRDNYEALQAAVFNVAATPEAYPPEDRDQYIEAWSQPGALTGSLNWYRASEAGPPRNDTEAQAMQLQLAKAEKNKTWAVTVPTLVIWGMQDNALLPPNLDGLDSYVPDLTIQRIPEGTHWVIREYPDQVNSAIRAFIEGK